MMSSPPLPNRAAVAVWGVALVLAVVVGLQSEVLHLLPLGAGIALPFAAVGAFCLIMQGPRWCVAGMAAGTILGLFQVSVAVGPIDVRATDLFYTGLVGWAILLRTRGGAAGHQRVAQTQIGIWVAALGLSLVAPLVRDPSETLSSVIGFLRLLQTVTLLWLVPYAITSQRDRLFLLRTIQVAGVVEVVRAVLQAVAAGELGGRLVGANGPNGTGLICAVILITVLHSPVPQSTWVRVAVGVIATTGLGLSRSIGSIAAVGVVLGVFGIVPRPAASGRARALLAPTRIAILVVGLALTIAAIRPANLPGSRTFEESSSVHRAILGFAGVELFVSHPLLGVGWQRSSRADVIGSRELAARLRLRFRNARAVFFPDKNPGAVHNAYVQMMAEAGLIGIGSFVVAIVFVRRRLARLLTMTAPGSPEHRTARVACMVVVAVLVWWNDNTLFGAQPETVLGIIFLGMLASPMVGSIPTGDGARQDFELAAMTASAHPSSE